MQSDIKLKQMINSKKKKKPVEWKPKAHLEWLLVMEKKTQVTWHNKCIFGYIKCEIYDQNDHMFHISFGTYKSLVNAWVSVTISTVLFIYIVFYVCFLFFGKAM